MVFYRKYRPQIIEELDNKNVREMLTATLSNKKSVPHAFLFTGPKGLGKTSAARIVAKVVNCEEKSKIKNLPAGKAGQKSKVQVKSQKLETIEPCNKCSQCTSIMKGTNLDVIEIDGASNRGIDEIRDLREKIKLAPASATTKIYIIDEVHMLTTEAFNALLKTLEEPPQNVIFVLCTTESYKVPATIASRCFNIPFSKATSEELLRSFKRVVRGEKLSVADGILEKIAELSDGSFRDGAKILEELALASKNGKITEEIIESHYKIASIEQAVEEMLLYLREKNSQKALLLLSNLLKEGVDTKYFIEKLLLTLHKILLVLTGVEKSEHKANFSLEEIKALVNVLMKAYEEVRFAVLPQLPLELVIVEWTENGAFTWEIKNKTVSSARGPVTPSPTPVRQASSSLRSSAPSDVTLRVNPRSDDLFRQLIDKVKLQNHSVAGLLRGCTIRQTENGLVIEAAYKFHKDKLSESKTLALLEEVSADLIGKPVGIEVLLKNS